LNDEFQKLNQERRAEYRKNSDDEDLIRAMNEALLPIEESSYVDCDIEHPYIFVFGLPRSGTTLITQLIGHCLDTGFVNNFAARYWQVPVTGIRFARALGLTGSSPDIESAYGATSSLLGIHEFGYFWRDRLRISTFEDIARFSDRETTVDWDGLRLVLANVQRQFGAPMIMKNVLGSYHLARMKKVLGKVIYIYIERDELDVAQSILEARRKYYDDLNRWWSYVPPEYGLVIDLDYWRQIAGQVVLLKSYYEQQVEGTSVRDCTMRVAYADLVSDPEQVFGRLSELSTALYGQPVASTRPAPTLELRSRQRDAEERERFRALINDFRSNGEFTIE